MEAKRVRCLPDPQTPLSLSQVTLASCVEPLNCATLRQLILKKNTDWMDVQNRETVWMVKLSNREAFIQKYSSCSQIGFIYSQRGFFREVWQQRDSVNGERGSREELGEGRGGAHRHRGGAHFPREVLHQQGLFLLPNSQFLLL